MKLCNENWSPFVEMFLQKLLIAPQLLSFDCGSWDEIPIVFWLRTDEHVTDGGAVENENRMKPFIANHQLTIQLMFAI